MPSCTTATHAFNYSLLGRLGFELNAALIDACDCWDFEYSRLDDALRTFEDLVAMSRRWSGLLQALREPRRWRASTPIPGTCCCARRRLRACWGDWGAGQAAGIEGDAAAAGAPAHDAPC